MWSPNPYYCWLLAFSLLLHADQVRTDMDKSQIIALYDQDQRQTIEYPGMRREVTPNVVRLVDTSDAGEGVIVWSRLDEATADAVIREQVRYFGAIQQDFEWKVYDYDRPHDLKEQLRAHGFSVEEVEAIMVLDLDEAPEALWQPVHHDVRRITHPEQLADVQAVVEQVWYEDYSWLVAYLGNLLLTQTD